MRWSALLPASENPTAFQPQSQTLSAMSSVKKMSNRNYVCFECRTSKRADATYGLNTGYRCSQCQGKLHELPWRWRIPKRTDDTEWNKLRKMYAELENSWLPRKASEGLKKLAEIDAKIDAISKSKNIEDKEDRIKFLQWKRREIEKKYTEQTHATDAATRRR